MGRTVSFDETMLWNGGWASFPSLDDLYTSPGEQRQKAKEAAQKLADSVTGYCSEQKLPLISLEISVLDRRRGLAQQLAFTTYFFALSYFGLIFRPENPHNKTDERPSPYAMAMRSMLDAEIGLGGERAEPILFHPALRNPDVAYVVGGPLVERLPAEGPSNGPVLNLPEVSYPLRFKSLETGAFTGAGDVDYQSDVSAQLDNFLYFLVQHTREIGARRPTLKAQFEAIAQYLSRCRLLVFPFMRDSMRTRGNGDRLIDLAAYGESVSGIFFFALVGPIGLQRHDDLEVDGDQASTPVDHVVKLADYLTKLCLGLALGEQRAAAEQIKLHGEIVEDAAHDIVNYVKSFQTDMIFTHLFRAKRDTDSLTVDDLQWFPDPDNTVLEPEQIREDKEAMVVIYKTYRKNYKKILTQLMMLELPNQTLLIKEKHQHCDDLPQSTGFYLNDVIARAIDDVNDYVARSANANRIVPEFRLGKMENGKEVFFPSHYIKDAYIIEELYELFINSSKHGLAENGVVKVLVITSFNDKTGHPVAAVTISNQTRGGARWQNQKRASLWLIPGLRTLVTPPDQSRGNSPSFYKVKVELGSIIAAKDGNPVLAAPELRTTRKITNGRPQ